MNYEKKKKEYETALKAEAQKILENELKNLKKICNYFMEDCYMKESYREFDKHGEFVSVLNLPQKIVESLLDVKNKDFVLFQEILTQASEDKNIYFSSDYNSIYALLSEPIILNFSNTKNNYAIYCKELGLKINYDDLLGKNNDEKYKYALLLIEQTQRKKDFFYNIIEVDYYGGVIREISFKDYLKICSLNISKVSNAELEKLLEQYEEVET